MYAGMILFLIRSLYTVWEIKKIINSKKLELNFVRKNEIKAYIYMNMYTYEFYPMIKFDPD